MRLQLFILAFLFSVGSLAQVIQPELKRITIRGDHFMGKIDTLFIEVYLQQINKPNYYEPYALLEGWYRSESDSTNRIALKGIESAGKLLLFTGEEFRDSIDALIDRGDAVYYEEAYLDPWEILSDSAFDQFEERFFLQGVNSYWQRGSQFLSLQLEFDAAKLNVYDEYLCIENDCVDLHDLAGYHHGFELLAWSDREVLLSFSYTSNTWNPMGRCGAGIEHGLCRLSFDEQGRFLSHQFYWLESCNQGYYTNWEVEGNKLHLHLHKGEEERHIIDFDSYNASADSIAVLLSEMPY